MEISKNHGRCLVCGGDVFGPPWISYGVRNRGDVPKPVHDGCWQPAGIMVAEQITRSVICTCGEGDGDDAALPHKSWCPVVDTYLPQPEIVQKPGATS